MENSQHTKHFSTLGLIMFLGSLLIFVIQYIFSKIASLVPAIADSPDLSLLSAMVPMYLIAFPLFFLILKKLPASEIPKRGKMGPGKIILAFFMCYSLSYICNLIATIITYIISILKQDAVDNVILTVTSNINIFTTFFVMVICAPIFEELLFRKALISRTIQYGEGISILLSGFTFALFHGNLVQFMYAFALGMFFGFIYCKTGNIRYTIILHMLINFMGGVLSTLVLKVSRIMEFSEEYMPLLESSASQDELMTFITEYMDGLLIFIGYFAILIIFVLTGLILLLLNIKKYKVSPGSIIIEKGKRFTTYFLNLGMILFTVYWIIMIIYQLFA